MSTTKLVLRQMRNSVDQELCGIFDDFEALDREMKRLRDESSEETRELASILYPIKWYEVTEGGFLNLWTSVPPDSLFNDPEQHYMLLVEMNMNKFWGFVVKA